MRGCANNYFRIMEQIALITSLVTCNPGLTIYPIDRALYDLLKRIVNEGIAR